MKDINTDLANASLMADLTAEAFNNEGVATKFIYLVHSYLTDKDLAEAADFESYGDDPYDTFEDKVMTWANMPNSDEVLSLLDVFKGLRGESWYLPYGDIAAMLVVYYNHYKEDKDKLYPMSQLFNKVDKETFEKRYNEETETYTCDDGTSSLSFILDDEYFHIIEGEGLESIDEDTAHSLILDGEYVVETE